VFPDLPSVWQALLGRAHWSLEWIDDAGVLRVVELAPGAGFAVTVVNDASSPVLAYPYWPGRQVRRGDLKPAGALFPWDVRGGDIVLSWQGGIDAVLWRELSRADNVRRQAVSFNWQRWRGAWQDGSFPSAVVRDPWVCDWQGIAAQIAASGFDKRRVVAAGYAHLTLTGKTWQGAWFGQSPFDAGTFAAAGEPLTLPLIPPTAIAFGRAGLIRYSSTGFLLYSWPE
jgi:hypothetical protein